MPAPGGSSKPKQSTMSSIANTLVSINFSHIDIRLAADRAEIRAMAEEVTTTLANLLATEF